MAGWWEFPGGKAAEGESGAAALARELAEELGIRLRGCHPLLQLRHDYPDRRIELEVFVVTEFEGTPASLEGQALAWVAPEQLHGQQLLPADRPIIAALTAASAAASA
jgi:8-oxo-dGTP diphosphatase